MSPNQPDVLEDCYRGYERGESDYEDIEGHDGQSGMDIALGVGCSNSHFVSPLFDAWLHIMNQNIEAYPWD
jgi:hypothetical protein